MQTKLTLRMDERLIDQAKAVAERKGKSLSKMVADYFEALIKNELPTDEIELPPRVKSFCGLLAGSEVDESDYKKHLESRYL